MIRPATPHTVAWPVVPSMFASSRLDERRHWRNPCWKARDPAPLTPRGGIPPAACRGPAKTEGGPVQVRMQRVGEVGTWLRSVRTPSCRPPRSVTLHTADGLELVGEVALPLDREPVATIVCLHPLPTHGGMMDDHVFRKAATPRLPALAGVAVLRFNTRGTSSAQGTSQGEFDHARGGVRRRRGHRVRRVPRPARHLGRRLVVRHRPHADARQRPGCEGRDPARPRCGSPTWSTSRRGPSPASR